MGFSFNGTTSQSMGLATRITNEYRMPDLRKEYRVLPGLLLNGCNSFRDGLVYLHNHKRQRASDHWTACRRRNIDY